MYVNATDGMTLSEKLALVGYFEFSGRFDSHKCKKCEASPMLIDIVGDRDIKLLCSDEECDGVTALYSHDLKKMLEAVDEKPEHSETRA